jgi:hypothetical protein
MQFENYFENTQNLFHQGYGHLFTLRSTKGALEATDRNNNSGIMVTRIDKQVEAINDIEKGYERIIAEIHKEKRKILAALGAQSALSKLDDEFKYPAKVDGGKIKKDVADYFHPDAVLKSILQYRDTVVKICANSHYDNSNGKLQRIKKYTIGEINRNQLKGDRSDHKYFRQLLNDAYLDDKETLFKILISLTPRSEENQRYSAQQALHFLCIQESRILIARKYAMGLISSRVTNDCYSFDKIIPLAYGPSFAKAGEEVEIKVMIAALDSENNPEVTCEQGGDVEVSEGVATLRLKVDETTTFNGTITILNKQGASKTKKWEVTVPVID